MRITQIEQQCSLLFPCPPTSIQYTHPHITIHVLLSVSQSVNENPITDPFPHMYYVQKTPDEGVTFGESCSRLLFYLLLMTDN